MVFTTNVCSAGSMWRSGPLLVLNESAATEINKLERYWNKQHGGSRKVTTYNNTPQCSTVYISSHNSSCNGRNKQRATVRTCLSFGKTISSSRVTHRWIIRQRSQLMCLHQITFSPAETKEGSIEERQKEWVTIGTTLNGIQKQRVSTLLVFFVDDTVSRRLPNLNSVWQEMSVVLCSGRFVRGHQCGVPV